MRKEIEEFYLDNNLPVDRILDVGVVNHGIHQEYQKTALERVYKQVSKGDLYLARHQIAWKVWEVARDIRSKDRKEAHIEAYVAAKPVIPPPEVIEAMKEMPDPSVVIKGEVSRVKEMVIPVGLGIVLIGLLTLFSLYGG